MKNAQVHWEIHRESSQEILTENTFIRDLEEDSAAVIDTISFIIPEDYVGNYVVEMCVRGEDSKILSTNSCVVKACI